MRSGIVHHKSDRKSCILPTADRNTELPLTPGLWASEGCPFSQSDTDFKRNRELLVKIWLRWCKGKCSNNWKQFFLDIQVWLVLRSAVGKTRDLRSDLWWTIPLRILLDQFRDTLWIPADQVSPSQTYGSTWVVLWLLFCRSAPSMFPNKRSTLQGPFRGVPSR